MTHVFKKSLMMAALVAAFAVAQAGTSMAQSTVTVEDAAEIPAAASGTAQAFYDPATGDVYLSVGDGLSILGLQGTTFDLANNQSIPGFPAVTSGELAFLFLPPLANVPIPTGIFNLGNILPSDPSITDVASFQAASFGGAEVQFSSDTATGPVGFGVIAGGEVVPAVSYTHLTLPTKA